jgi:shikimate kinase
MTQNIVLIGFMGSGKSSVGKVLAAELNAKFIDMDSVIESEQGCAIRQIFADYGEAHFRTLERTLFANLCANETNAVISAGGGAITAIDNFKQLGCVVYLKIGFDDLLTRLQAEEFDKRPLFQDIDFARKLYDFREPLYSVQADITIDAMQDIATITKEIICFLSSGSLNL